MLICATSIEVSRSLVAKRAIPVPIAPTETPPPTTGNHAHSDDTAEGDSGAHPTLQRAVGPFGDNAIGVLVGGARGIAGAGIVVVGGATTRRTVRSSPAF